MSEPEKKPRSFLFKAFKVILLLLVLAVAAFVGLGLFVLDGKCEIARETTIKAPPEAVHKQVGDLRERNDAACADRSAARRNRARITRWPAARVRPGQR